MSLKSIIALSATLGLGVSTASASTYSTDFESFTAGSINGQDGWTATNPAFAQGIVNVGGAHGNVFLRANTYTSGSFGDQPMSPGVTPVGEVGSVNYAGNHLSTASFDFRAVNDGSNDGSQTSVTLTDAPGSRMWNVSLENGPGGVSLTTYNIDPTLVGGHVSFNPVTLATGLTGWHTLSVSSTFVNGSDNDQVNYYLDGNLVGSTGTWEEYYRLDTEQAGNGNQLFASDRLLFRTGGAAVAGAAGFHFDNVSLATAVPEPTGIALLGLGAGALLLQRRRPRARFKGPNA